MLTRGSRVAVLIAASTVGVIFPAGDARGGDGDPVLAAILVERPDASFAAAHLWGDGDEHDSIKSDEPPVAISGAKSFWSEMMDLVNAGVADESDYERLQEYLDLDSLIPYSMVNHYIGNVDAPACICGDDRPRNFYAARRRTVAGRFHFFLWDS